ncbi:hypothetical protein HXX76_014180 [Chlamydomonas incerta]|uniref:Uncharacterized protein n=1 Tax=Chlamydomonas incerta TaxID=51695 RepID=A0A835VQ26_CHLIN|nr:hypothetical protein HXX76_014180 [Chlamydomonas incerta]|eukprot:KAG2425022.1 hypothetical protein HXX76_014180 [Chlamydomonas incerta]
MFADTRVAVAKGDVFTDSDAGDTVVLLAKPEFSIASKDQMLLSMSRAVTELRNTIGGNVRATNLGDMMSVSRFFDGLGGEPPLSLSVRGGLRTESGLQVASAAVAGPCAFYGPVTLATDATLGEVGNTQNLCAQLDLSVRANVSGGDCLNVRRDMFVSGDLLVASVEASQMDVDLDSLQTPSLLEAAEGRVGCSNAVAGTAMAPGLGLSGNLACSGAMISPSMTVAAMVRAVAAAADAVHTPVVSAGSVGADAARSQKGSAGALDAMDLRTAAMACPLCVANVCSVHSASVGSLRAGTLAAAAAEAPVLGAGDLEIREMVLDEDLRTGQTAVFGSAALASAGAHNALLQDAVCDTMECWDLRAQTLRITSGVVGVTDGARIDAFIVTGDLTTTGNVSSRRQECHSLTSNGLAAGSLSLAALQAANVHVADANVAAVRVTDTASVQQLTCHAAWAATSNIAHIEARDSLVSQEWEVVRARASRVEAGNARILDARSGRDLTLPDTLRSGAVDSRLLFQVRAARSTATSVRGVAAGRTGVWGNCATRTETRSANTAAFHALSVAGRVDAVAVTAGNIATPRLLTTRVFTGRDLCEMREDCDVGRSVGPVGRVLGMSDTVVRGAASSREATFASASVSATVLAPNVSASHVAADLLAFGNTRAVRAATDTLVATDARGDSMGAGSMLVQGNVTCSMPTVSFLVSGGLAADALVAGNLLRVSARVEAGTANVRTLSVAADAAVAAAARVGPGGMDAAGLTQVALLSATSVTVSGAAALTSPGAVECSGPVRVAADAAFTGSLAAGQVAVSSVATLSGNLTVAGLLSAATTTASSWTSVSNAEVASLSVLGSLTAQAANCTVRLTSASGVAGSAAAASVAVGGTATSQSLSSNSLAVLGTASSPSVACGDLVMSQDRSYLQNASARGGSMRVQEAAACGSLYASQDCSVSDAAVCSGAAGAYQMALRESCQVGGTFQVVRRPLVLNGDTIMRNANDFYVPQADTRVFIAKNLSVIGRATMRCLQIINTMNNEYSLLDTVVCDELHTPSLKAKATTRVLGPATLGVTSVSGSVSTGGSAVVESLRGQTGRANAALLRGGLSAESSLAFSGAVSAQSITCSDYTVSGAATFNSLKCTGNLGFLGGTPLSAGRLFSREAFVKQRVSVGSVAVAGEALLGEAQCGELVSDVIGPLDATGSLVLQTGGLATHGAVFGTSSAELPDPANTSEGSIQNFMLTAVDLAEFHDLVLIYNSLYRVISQGTLSALNDTPVIMRLTDLLLVSAGDYSVQGEDLSIRLWSVPQQLGAQGIFVSTARQGTRPTHVFLGTTLFHLVRFCYYTPVGSTVPSLVLTLSGLTAADLPDTSLRPLAVLMGRLSTPDRLVLDASSVISNLSSPGAAYPALSGTVFGGRMASYEVDAILHPSPDTVCELVPGAPGARSQPVWLCPTPAPKGTRPRVITFDAADFFSTPAPPAWDGGAKFVQRFVAPQPLSTTLPTDPIPAGTTRISRAAYSDRAVYFDHASIIQYDKVLRKYLSHVSVGLSNVQCPCNLSNVVAYEITSDMGVDKIAASLYFPHSTYLQYDLNKDAASKLLNQVTYDASTKTATLHHTTAWSVSTSASPSMPSYQPTVITALGTSKQAAQTYEQVYNSGCYAVLDVTEGGVTYPEVHQCAPVMQVRRAVADDTARDQYALVPTALKFAPYQFFHYEYLGVQAINYLIREEDLPVISLYTPDLPEDPPLYSTTAPLSVSMKNNKLKVHYKKLYHVINIPVSGVSLVFNAAGSFSDVTKPPPSGAVTFTTGEQPYSSAAVPIWNGTSYAGGNSAVEARYVTGASMSTQTSADGFSILYKYTFTISSSRDVTATGGISAGMVDLAAALSDVTGGTYTVSPASGEGFWKLVMLGTSPIVLLRAEKDVPTSGNSRTLSDTEKTWFMVDLSPVSPVSSTLGVVDLFQYINSVPLQGGTTTLELTGLVNYHFKPAFADPTLNPMLFSSSFIERNKFNANQTVFNTDTTNGGRVVSAGAGQFNRYFLQFNYVVNGTTQAVSDMHLYLGENISKSASYIWVGGYMKTDTADVYAASFFILCDATGAEIPVPAGLEYVPGQNAVLLP